ncbi:helix-turn-helix domain-containing protein [Deinococcus apachensis]|uniref:helix-turn-helix domain-containing protein n=1 Tax=Deinococcus apachensis TaxID=309886 RepID=UPI00037DEF23|nr:helix-turn-helix domain-containing protein [Deinococcus apachensis]
MNGDEQQTASKLVLTPKEVEPLLGLSKNSVIALLRSGRLRAVRYGRRWLIPREAVAEFLAGGK